MVDWEEWTSTYQVADNNLAFFSGGDGGHSSGDSGSLGLSLVVGLCRGGVLGDSSGGNSGLGGATSATGIIAAAAGDLVEALVELGRHYDCLF